MFNRFSNIILYEQSAINFNDMHGNEIKLPAAIFSHVSVVFPKIYGIIILRLYLRKSDEREV